MKKLYTLIASVVITSAVFAQAPSKMSYQAVVRDAGDALVTSQAVGMQLSIVQGSISGTVVYVETQTPTSNLNGLVSVEIGSGTVVSGTFNSIDWSNGPYFIKTETDPTGGTTYTITGTSQLMSVPYALHAKTAQSITGTINYTETDPIFGASIANGITALDTAYWNNHTVDTDTQLDSSDIAAIGFVAGAHTIDTDTQLDSSGIAAIGFVAGAHTIDTQLDSTSIANMGFVQNERIYFSATGASNNSTLPIWTSEKTSNKIDTSGTANVLKVQEAGLYFIACNIGISSANRNVNLYVNSIAKRASNNFAGYSGGTWGQVTANWSILLKANDLIELKISSGVWDGVGIDNLTIFKIN